MEWVQTITICGTMITGLAFLSAIIIWMVGKIDADVKGACVRIDEQGKRTDKLIYAFMDFQRDTERAIHRAKIRK